MYRLRLVCAAISASACAFTVSPVNAQQRPAPGEVRTDGGCTTGLVWREAFPGDHLCVSHEMRETIRLGNLNPNARHKTGFAGVILADCIDGYVWREARPGDIVCVTPEVRALVLHDNAVAPHAGWSNPVGRPAAPPPSTPVSVYQMSAWSPWVLKDGVRYRYRWGWNSAIPAFARSIDATFEIANQTATRWRGTARALNCANGTLGPSQDVNLAPGQQAMISFKTDNCGTLAQPHFKGLVVRSSSF